jgi:hypothetical protein
MIQQQGGIINSMAINEDGVVASGADNGSLWCAPRGCVHRNAAVSRASADFRLRSPHVPSHVWSAGHCATLHGHISDCTSQALAKHAASACKLSAY